MAAVVTVSTFTNVHFLWYNGVGAVTVSTTGLLISVAFKGPHAAREA